MEESDGIVVRWIVKAAIWLAIVATLVSARNVTIDTVALVLVGIALDIGNARLFPSIAATVAKCTTFVALAAIDESFALLCVSAATDLALRTTIGLTAIPVTAAAVLAPPELRIAATVAACIAACTGWTVRRHGDAWRSHTGALDRERRSRYRLEEAQRRLEATSRELIRATEYAERTRIAHAIHDDVGHRLTGVLMQLQAARHLVTSQPTRSMHMLDTSTGALTEAVEAVREAVYDLRPRVESDATALRRTCAEFRLCPVDISLDDEGYSRLARNYRESCLLTVRELLTNAMRHSRADRVWIRIDVGAYLKIVYRDDGVGAKTVREGLGIGGIRVRTEELGGTLATSGHSGFVVRIAIPLNDSDAGTEAP